MHDSRTVANAFLALAEENNDTLPPMQVLKLVYNAHGWMLGLYGRPLVRYDVQAWQYGPVIPPLYDAMRQFRSHPVKGPLPTRSEELSAEEIDIIRQTYTIYGQMGGMALSRLTHAPGTPWDRTYQHGYFSIPISNDLIEDHYRQLAADNTAHT